VNDLTAAVRELAGYDRRSPALLVQTPSGDYHVSPNGYGEPAGSAYVISRRQLHELMVVEGLRREDLVEVVNAERLALAVDAFRQRRRRVE
jgi:hypothetical protein